MRRALIFLAALTACSPLPDTVGEAAPSGTVWVLAEANGADPGYPASLRFNPSGDVRGTGPCSRFTARQSAPLPWVEFEAIERTPRTCDNAAADDSFYLILGAMDFAEVAGNDLILSNAAGQSLYFRSGLGPNT